MGPPSFYLALKMTEPEEKNTRHIVMQQHGNSGPDRAIRKAQHDDRAHGIERFYLGLPGAAPCANG